MEVAFFPGTTPPLVQSILLKNMLGISPSPQRVKPQNIKNSESSSVTNVNSVGISKTDLLKSLCKVPIDQAVAETPTQSKKKSERVSPPRSKAEKEKKKVQSVNVVSKQVQEVSQVAQSVTPHFAGSAFLSSPHPDRVPMPDFDENFFN